MPNPKYLVSIVVWLALHHGLSAQKITPEGYFLGDSIKIGMPIDYTLSVKYPIELDVVFPDSLYDFAPFEIVEKFYFPTQSDSTTSYDSAVYRLMSFEIEPTQALALPVFILGNNDSTAVYPEKDSVVLAEMIEEVPDSIQLRQNTAYIHVPTQFNYPYLLIGLGVLVVVLIIVWVAFGKQIMKAYQLRKFKKAHEKYLQYFDKLVAQKPEESAEAVLLEWKRYLEQLLKKPYTKLTTKEILALRHNQGIEQSLRRIDGAIYGHASKASLGESFGVLRQYSDEQYRQKVQQIKNG